MSIFKKLAVIGAIALSICLGQSNPTDNTREMRYGIKGGTFTENVIFTDIDGNTYDVYKLLDEGKVIGFAVTWPTWSGCGPAVLEKYMPLWEQFGCNEHDFMLFELGKGWDTDESFRAWMEKWGGEYPAVRFNSKSPLYIQLYGPWGGAANSGLYLLKPDRDYFSPWSNYPEQVKALGIEENECEATEISYSSIEQSGASEVFAYKNGTVTFSIPNQQEVFFSLFSLNGKLVAQTKKQTYSAGNNVFKLDMLNGLAKGAYILRKNSNNSISTIAIPMN